MGQQTKNQAIMADTAATFEKGSKRTQKAVYYGDLIFPSAAALGRHLKFPYASYVYKYIRKGNYLGTYMAYVKKGTG